MIDDLEVVANCTHEKTYYILAKQSKIVIMKNFDFHILLAFPSIIPIDDDFMLMCQ